jgi:hypothetical protein
VTIEHVYRCFSFRLIFYTDFRSIGLQSGFAPLARGLGEQLEITPTENCLLFIVRP